MRRKKLVGGNYLTAQEVIEHFPELEEHHAIDDEMIGKLLRCHVLWGRYDSGKRKHLIHVESVRKFIQYLNEVLKNHMIDEDE